ncbi:hypothetical protein NON20_14530 [Synechocystis sp. B12]|nr:hypothetical protein NON20_14530 [Synechocystis sp. B12]
MDNHQLKVGTAIFAGQHRYLGELKPIRSYTEAIIRDYLKLEKSQYHLEEIHGSVLDYAVNQGDTYHQGSVLAIGDAVSTVNFLGGRHSPWYAGSQYCRSFCGGLSPGRWTSF